MKTLHGATAPPEIMRPHLPVPADAALPLRKFPVFKNLTVYRIAPGFSFDLTTLEDALGRARFSPCQLTQQESVGWVAPRGHDHGLLVESVQGQWILRLRMEQRLLPGSVVKEHVDELAARVEEETGRKPGKKMAKELKEQALLDLLPRAFTRTSALFVWICPQEGWLVVDTGSQGRADEVVALLVEALPGMGVTHLNTQESPATAMSQWLLEGQAPAGFTIDRECELKSADEMKSVVRYARHALDTEEVRQHIISGKRPTRLALSWTERVSFTLSEGLQLRKVALLDTVLDAQPSNAQADEEFDADVLLVTGELRRLLPDLVEALGGEQSLFEPAATAAPAVPGAAPVSPEGTAPAPTAETALDSPPW